MGIVTRCNATRHPSVHVSWVPCGIVSWSTVSPEPSGPHGYLPGKTSGGQADAATLCHDHISDDDDDDRDDGDENDSDDEMTVPEMTVPPISSARNDCARPQAYNAKNTKHNKRKRQSTNGNAKQKRWNGQEKKGTAQRLMLVVDAQKRDCRIAIRWSCRTCPWIPSTSWS